MRRRRGRVGIPVLVGAVLVGCTSEAGTPLDRIVTGWEFDGAPVSEEVLVVARGPEHCEWTDVVFLVTASTPGERIDPVTARQYVRDPDGDLPLSAGLDLDAELPGDAEPTGFANRAGIQLFVSRDGATAYLVDESGATEAWPRNDGVACA